MVDIDYINWKLEELLGNFAQKYIGGAEEELERLALDYKVGPGTSLYQSLQYRTACAWLLLALEDLNDKQRKEESIGRHTFRHSSKP